MAIVPVTTKDLSVVYSNAIGKFDLKIDVLNRLQTTRAQEKLTLQLIHYVKNEAMFHAYLKATSGVAIAGTVQNALSDFRSNQILFENENKANVIGYDIFQYVQNSYQRITSYPVIAFTINRLPDGFPITFGISRAYSGGRTNTIIESATLTPSKFTDNQKIYIGGEFTARPGDRKIEFFFFSNRYFDPNELLQQTQAVEAFIGSDPRQITLKIGAKTYGGNPVITNATLTAT